ncbi:MAG TPA: hypothetical protein VIH18_16730 [Candidatus Binatia bacterium]|jgi:hypothetical protein
MASETFKKRQKEVARREKQQKKFARRMERRNGKAPGEKEVRAEDSSSTESVARQGPTIL